MPIQRAVIKGLINSAVQTRTIFTAQVTESGGDTAEVLWNAYLGVFYSYASYFISDVWNSQEYELQELQDGQWPVLGLITQEFAGTVTGQQVANAVAFVLIGKAAGIRHIGRKFLSPLAESVVTGNVVDSSLAVHAGQVILSYVAPFTGLGGGTLVPGVTDHNGGFHPFVGGAVSSLLGSIRKRKPGLGI